MLMNVLQSIIEAKTWQNFQQCQTSEKKIPNVQYAFLLHEKCFPESINNCSSFGTKQKKYISEKQKEKEVVGSKDD